jgi:cation diffusion facilitator CzcD-associated flavoprotein CzcO
MSDSDSQKAVSSPWLDKPIHHQRHLKVIGIGAGASGLLFAYKLQRSFENFDLTLYEKNEDVGGTWLENKYPG